MASRSCLVLAAAVLLVSGGAEGAKKKLSLGERRQVIANRLTQMAQQQVAAEKIAQSVAANVGEILRGGVRIMSDMARCSALPGVGKVTTLSSNPPAKIPDPPKAYLHPLCLNDESQEVAKDCGWKRYTIARHFQRRCRMTSEPSEDACRTRCMNMPECIGVIYSLALRTCRACYKLTGDVRKSGQGLPLNIRQFCPDAGPRKYGRGCTAVQPAAIFDVNGGIYQETPGGTGCGKEKQLFMAQQCQSVESAIDCAALCHATNGLCKYAKFCRAEKSVGGQCCMSRLVKHDATTMYDGRYVLNKSLPSGCSCIVKAASFWSSSVCEWHDGPDGKAPPAIGGAVPKAQGPKQHNVG